MNVAHLLRIAEELKITVKQVEAVGMLLAEGATIPFIARYRKEVTDSLDEVAVGAIRDRLEQLAELDARRESILGSLEERGLLTPQLKESLDNAPTLSQLEDIYLPYRPKRRTRATIAREKGLEPLAQWLLEQADEDPAARAEEFVNAEKGVENSADALAGARDIIAELVSEDAASRERLRRLYREKGQVRSRLASKDKETEGAKYRDYFDWTEPLDKAPSHRVLAIFRGENEGFLSVAIAPPDDDAVSLLEAQFIRNATPASQEVRAAVQDSYKRLLGSSMETEIRKELKKRADDEAIRVFADNLRELLLASPLGRKSVLGIDPGVRTGCKIVCLDPQGKLLHHDVVFLQRSDRELNEAGRLIRDLVKRFAIEAVAIGNGTASRETEQFVRKLELPSSVTVVVVNESGASIYSASEVAREEFPDQDITVRGAVSIGRRLMDPLAELVKIDPKSIGVGQYQHDVDQGALKRSLDDTVMSCVNAVGVEVNTASRQLLTYVSGLGPQLAANIVAWRNENGAFRSRAQLRKVPRLGPKAFEQCAGFLRIHDGESPLDASAVHPESYSVVKQMAKDLDCTVADLMNSAELRGRVKLENYVTEKVGMPTLTDIMTELAKPGRDPREKFEAFSFADGVTKLEDLKPGMRLPGIVTNVTAFGAFVDVGVHQDGLVHVSQLADHFVKNPAEVVKAGQRVNVTVVEVDLQRKRIALSMQSNPGEAKQPRAERPAGGGGAPRNADPRPKPTAKPNWFTDALKKAR